MFLHFLEGLFIRNWLEPSNVSFPQWAESMVKLLRSLWNHKGSKRAKSQTPILPQQTCLNIILFLYSITTQIYFANIVQSKGGGGIMEH